MKLQKKERKKMKKAIRNYLKLVNEIINIQSPFDVEIVDIISYDKNYPFISFHTHSKLAKWTAVINSGSHGNEPIGIKIILRFLQEFKKDFLNHYNFIIFPVVNPYGYSYNIRKNGNNKYGNSGFIQKKSEEITQEAYLIGETLPHKIDLFIDIHSDLDKSGFYIYERKRPGKESLAEKSLTILRQNKIPVLENITVYREKCKNGVVIQPEKDGSMDDSMFKKGAIYSLCIEVPGKLSEDEQLIGGLLLLNNIFDTFLIQEKEKK